MKSGFIKIVAINLLIVLFLLVALEGITSLILAYRDSSHVTSGESVAEVRHTTWDPLLGWVNLPNVRIDDMYGKGLYLATNAQGFRNEINFSTKKKVGIRRVLCVGDSFTLGYGVSNKQTWCHVLSEIIPNLETVNMGQGGYGVDQAYLWYQRDGVKLQHDLVIFAFITSDFYRLQKKDFNGFSKPFLKIENGSLIATPPNKPDEKAQDSKSSSVFGSFLSQLRMVAFFRKLVWKLKLWGTTDGVLSPNAKKITAALFAELKQITQNNNSELLLVHLPNADDHPVNSKTDGLRTTLKQIASEKGLPYIDLVGTLQALPSGFDAQLLFEYGNHHFNVEGNQFMARHLQPEIEKIISGR